MKKHLHNDFCLYRFALSKQSTLEVIVASGPTAIAGFVGLLAPLKR